MTLLQMPLVTRLGLLTILLSVGMACHRMSQAIDAVAEGPSLRAYKAGNFTTLLRKEKIGEPVPEPPKDLFKLTQYISPVGELAAYVSPDPKDGKKHPLIIWRVGGFANSIGGTEWEDASADDDQSASQYRKAGVLMMYPSLRGGNNNPGFIEGCYGEVEDILAAAEYAKKLPYVDPTQIYLGGHSVGGTLALLVAAMDKNPFKAIISFGAAESTAGYGQENVPFDVKIESEVASRAPIHYLNSIKTDTWVIEATEGNIDSLIAMRDQCSNPRVHFFAVPGDHFSILAKLNSVVATQILAAAASPDHAFLLNQKLLTDALRNRPKAGK